MKNIYIPCRLDRYIVDDDDDGTRSAEQKDLFSLLLPLVRYVDVFCYYKMLLLP